MGMNELRPLAMAMSMPMVMVMPPRYVAGGKWAGLAGKPWPADRRLTA